MENMFLENKKAKEERVKSLVSKKVEPIVDGDNKVIGIYAKYMIFGVCVYKKVFYTPSKFGVTEWELPVNF